jgi:2-phosphoglycerate kinase
MGNSAKYLIGGAPTVGKSPAAAALAAHCVHRRTVRNRDGRDLGRILEALKLA